MLRLDRSIGRLSDAAGNIFRPADRTWTPSGAPATAAPVSMVEAVGWLQRESGARLRVPVGVIGPRDAAADLLDVAKAIGQGLARMGLAVICGGRQGIMQAVCEGVAAEGGLSIGLLPEAEPQFANPFVGVAISTGIGEARNALIARAALCLVAIGNSHGTLSEVALGLQFGKTVIGLPGAADVPGVRHCRDAAAALDLVAAVVLNLPDPEFPG
jgi:uncharacterized protein (TIGR00725 family)